MYACFPAGDESLCTRGNGPPTREINIYHLSLLMEYNKYHWSFAVLVTSYIICKLEIKLLQSLCAAGVLLGTTYSSEYLWHIFPTNNTKSYCVWVWVCVCVYVHVCVSACMLVCVCFYC